MLLASPPQGKPIPFLTWLSRVLLVFFAYALTGWFGASAPTDNSHITLFWLPSGIAVAALYRWPTHIWPGIFFAALILNLNMGCSPLLSTLIATGNTLGPFATTLLLRRFNCQLTNLQRTHSVTFVMIACVGMLIPSIFGNSAEWLLLATEPSEEQLRNILAWWMGDSLGVILITPLLLHIQQGHLQQLSTKKRHFTIVILCTVIATLICFPLNGLWWGTPAPIVFMSFVGVAWASLTFGLLGGTATTLISSFIAIWSTLHGLGPFNQSDSQLSYWLVWIYITSLSLLSLMIATAHAELGAASSQLGDSNKEQEKQKKHLEAILQTIPDLLIEMDRDGRFLSANGMSVIPTLAPDRILNKNIADLLTEEALTQWRNALKDADEWGITQGKLIDLKAANEHYWLELSIAKKTGQYRHDDKFICLARDITKRVASHQYDLANEQRFRNIFEATRNIAVQGYNRFHEVIFWNQASEDTYGFSASDAMGKKLEDLIIPNYMREGVHQAIEDWHEQNISIPSGELALHNAQGEEVWVFSNHVLINTPDSKEMYCLDIDLRPQRNAMMRLEEELAERKQIEAALRSSEQRLEAAQLTARIAHWTWNAQLDNYQFSPSMTQLFQLPSEYLQCPAARFLALLPLEDQRNFKTALTKTLATYKPLSQELQLEINGHNFWLQAQGKYSVHNQEFFIEGTFQDITERKRLDLALAAAAAGSAVGADFFLTILTSLTSAIDAQHALISLIGEGDTATTHTYVKQAVLQDNFEYSLENCPCIKTQEDNLCFLSSNASSLYKPTELFNLSNIESYISICIKNTQGSTIGILVVLSEKSLVITAQMRALMQIFSERIAGELQRAADQEQIFNLAFFDPLTRLPNRRMLLDRLKLAMAQSERTQKFGALLFIDLDHFKLLNDTRGHHIGDQLLVQVAERINCSIRTTDLAARLGGDEFVVIFDNLDRNADVAALEAKNRAEELHALINLPYPLQQAVHHCTISIGVNLFKGNDQSIDDMFRHADAAMYQAKDSGRNTIRFFDPTLQSHMEKRTTIEADLRIALNEPEQLFPYYQVQVDESGFAVGAELLMRWKHPDKGMIPPCDFIPVAEHTGLIVAIGKMVLEHACTQLLLWQQDPDLEKLTLAVNVSPIQFNQASFVEDVLAIVVRTGIKPQQLKLELTESSLLKNVDQSIEKMQQLQKMGIGFSMDDFGIGYSSLSYLKRLPLDQLKIDQSFVRDIALDPNDRVIVCTIIAMAQNMNLQVIAEGVETKEQQLFLAENGCRMYQGYYFGRPLPVQEFEQQIKTRP